MEPITAAIGLALSAAGLFGSNKAAKKQAKAERAAAIESSRLSAEVSGYQQQQEADRMSQMLMESQFNQRNIIRNTQIQSALAVNAAANSGYSSSDSSGVQGAFGQIQGDAGQQSTLLSANTNFGIHGFELNRKILQAQNASAQLQSTYNQQMSRAKQSANFYNGLYKLGSAINGNSAQIASGVQSLTSYAQNPV